MEGLTGYVVKRSMVLALFYVVAIRSLLKAIRFGTIKSVHRWQAKIKQFLQSRKYIYFWRDKNICN
jgi:hypothetical protein